jgi:outer membrane protein TolC
VGRDRVLIASAARVVSMSLTAYREGAQSLPNVLEAQRTARDVLSQYIDDLANAWVATAELRVLAIPVPSVQP